MKYILLIVDTDDGINASAIIHFDVVKVRYGIFLQSVIYLLFRSLGHNDDLRITLCDVTGCCTMT